MSDYSEFVKPAPQSMTYGKYLKVHDLLTLQEELSSPKEHDETLFIIIHQTYELWFKQIRHELDNMEKMLADNQIMGMIRSLNRITSIQRVLVHQIEILETMTPNEFNKFRSHLNPASGFQSFQFRVLEFRLGMKNVAHLNFFAHDPAAHAQIEAAMNQPSLYDHFFAYLARQGFSVPETVLKRDITQAHEANDAIARIFTAVYEKPEANYPLYIALEGLYDLDEFLILWRFRHVQMVRRMIGDMGGTGGSLGARYLQSTLSKSAFPELWEVRNLLGKPKV